MNFTIHAGDKRSLRIDLGETDRAFVDGDILSFTAKTDYSHSDDEAIFAYTSEGSNIEFTPGERTAWITLNPEDSASLHGIKTTALYYDVQLETVDGDGPWTILSGNIIVRSDVTRDRAMS